MVQYRKYADVDPQNKFLFAQGKDHAIGGAACVRVFANKLGLENFTSTKLRNHLATTAQIMALEPSQLQQLAEFMGHELNVHKRLYRLSSDILHKAKLGKLYLCMEDSKANVHRFKNKNFDDIQMDDGMLHLSIDDMASSDEEKEEDRNREEEEENGESQLSKRISSKRACTKRATKFICEDMIDDSDADETYEPTAFIIEMSLSKWQPINGSMLPSKISLLHIWSLTYSACLIS